MRADLSPRVVLDRSALLDNLAAIKHRTDGHCAVTIMLKANAYGHGLTDVAELLAQHVSVIGVSEAEDGFALLEAGTTARVLLIGPASADEQSELLSEGVDVTLDDLDRLRQLISCRPRCVGQLHLFVDTGLRRLGIAPADLRTALDLARSAELPVRAVCTHPRSADAGDWCDVACEAKQIESVLRDHAISRHSGGTSVAIERPDLAGEQVRVGIGVFGYCPHPRQQGLVKLRPVLQVEAPILAINHLAKGEAFGYAGTAPSPADMPVATVGMGACHGLTPDLVRGGGVVVNGRRAPFVGGPTLEYSQVDLSRVPAARVGDTAVAIGGVEGTNTSVPELATRLGVVPDHVLVKISPRIAREVRN